MYSMSGRLLCNGLLLCSLLRQSCPTDAGCSGLLPAGWCALLCAKSVCMWCDVVWCGVVCPGRHMLFNQCAACLSCSSTRGVGVNDILVLVLCAKPVHLACCGVLTAWLDKPWVVEPGLLIKAHTAVVSYITMARSLSLPLSPLLGSVSILGGFGWNVGGSWCCRDSERGRFGGCVALRCHTGSSVLHLF